MLKDKLIAVINEVNTQAAEREELIENIAIALLTRKNLFILGDTGQAKSYVINEFRKRITGAKQFERLLSKQADEEQLFGRLDLASLIPGSIPYDELISDPNYLIYYNKLKALYEEYSITGENELHNKAANLTKKMQEMKDVIYALNSNSPRIKTEGKIPDSNIVFLDEIFKANDGILNSLLTALNERVYTNEGQVVQIPVISFFAASNEIPDFNNPAEKILKPLYDRLELKVFTKYVEDRQNRLNILSQKQRSVSSSSALTTITLNELVQMQHEVESIIVPDAVNELMDDILCELRRMGIHVSDRKFFNYYPLARAKAYLRGGHEVSTADLQILKNYLWTKPEEINVIEQLLRKMCENPIHSKVMSIISMSNECFDDLKDNKDNKRAFIKFRNELIRLYDSICVLKASIITNNDADEINNAVTQLEKISEAGHSLMGFTYAPLIELKELQ